MPIGIKRKNAFFPTKKEFGIKRGGSREAEKGRLGVHRVGGHKQPAGFKGGDRESCVLKLFVKKQMEREK